MVRTFFPRTVSALSAPPSSYVPPDETWVPGDPLYSSFGSRVFSFFNFRYDTETELCGCGDTARWWADGRAWDIAEDPFAAFIQEYHVWVNDGRPEAEA